MNTDDLLSDGFIGSPDSDSPIWDWECWCGNKHYAVWQAQQNEHYLRRPLMQNPEKRNMERIAGDYDIEFPSLHLSRGQFETALLKQHVAGNLTWEQFKEINDQLQS